MSKYEEKQFINFADFDKTNKFDLNVRKLKSIFNLEKFSSFTKWTIFLDWTKFSKFKNMNKLTVVSRISRTEE